MTREKKEVARRRKGRCRWCRKTADLCRSHLISKFWAKKHRRAYGARVEVGPGLSTPQQVQDGAKEPLLCEACEQRFGLVEQRVKRNWDAMRREVFCPPDELRIGGYEELIKLTRGEDYWEPTRTGADEGEQRWIGVDAVSWRKLAAATAWRCAVSEKYKSTIRGEDIATLRTIATTGETQGRAPALRFSWVTLQKIGLGAGHLANQGFELPAGYTRGGDISMSFGGFTLALTLCPRPSHEVQLFDIGPKGTWMFYEEDWGEGERGRWLTGNREQGQVPHQTKRSGAAGGRAGEK